MFQIACHPAALRSKDSIFGAVRYDVSRADSTCPYGRRSHLDSTDMQIFTFPKHRMSHDETSAARRPMRWAVGDVCLWRGEAWRHRSAHSARVSIGEQQHSNYATMITRVEVNTRLYSLLQRAENIATLWGQTFSEYTRFAR